MAETMGTVAIVSIMYVVVLFLIASRAMRFISNEERRFRKAMQNEANRKGSIKVADEIQKQILAVDVKPYIPSDIELPGMWENADFMGGETDT